MKQTVRKNRTIWVHRLAGLLCFVLLALLLVGAADAVLYPKSDTMSAFYAEPSDSLDVLFVGGSHAAAAFNPIQLWQEKGFTSYTLYSWGQPAWTTYHYVVEALKSQRPSVVVVEAFGFMYGAAYMSDENFDVTSDDYSLRINPGLNRLRLAMAMSRWQTNSRPFYRYASLLRYHGRWKNLTADDFTWHFVNHYATGKGYGPIYSTEAFPQQAAPGTPVAAQMHPGCREYLYKLIALAQDKGFSLVLAAAPYVVEAESEWGVWRQITDICAENNVPFLDYNGAGAGLVGFDFGSDMAEHAHVNLYGAEKITTHVGAFLTQQYALADRRGDPAFAYWQDAARAEAWDQEKMRLRLSPTATEYFVRLQNPDLAAFIVSRGDVSGAGNEPLQEGFAALGLDTQVLADEGAFLAVVDGGRVVQQQAQAGPALLRATYTVGGMSATLLAGGDGAGITIDGQEWALGHANAVCVVVVDKRDGSIVQSVVFCPAEGSITRTD